MREMGPGPDAREQEHTVREDLWAMNYVQRYRIGNLGEFDLDGRPSRVRHSSTVSNPSIERDVRMSGAIAWSASPRGIRAQFRPSLTTKPALERVMGWLQSEAGPRVHVRYWAEGGWNDELHGTPRAAARRIEKLTQFYGGGHFGALRRRIKSSSEVAEIGRHARLLDFWRERAGRFEGDEDLRAIQDLTAGRSTLFHFADNMRFHMISAGKGMAAGLQNWLSNQPGASLDAYPDAEYRAQVQVVYAAAMIFDSPVFDEVDGFFKVPREQCVRRTYHRIVLPLQAGSKRFLISASMLDDAIDLLP